MRCCQRLPVDIDKGRRVHAGCRKSLWLRGLNHNYDHDLKHVFKSAITKAVNCAGCFHDFYETFTQLEATSPKKPDELALRGRQVHVAGEPQVKTEIPDYSGIPD
jgi:hypothetical protein